MNYRLPAEWEEQRAVQITFPHADSDWRDHLEAVTDCFVQIVSAISRFQEVWVVCDEIERVKMLLKGAADMHQVSLFEIPSNDTWARDHGGITVWADGQKMIWDFMFNGWGLKFPAYRDNLITGRLAQQGAFGGVPVQHGGLVLEGGAIDSDGAGTLLTTAACLLSPNRNPHLDREELTAVLHERFGLQRILWLENGYLAGDDTDSHIDTLARFCDPSTIAYVRCDDQHDEHYAALQAMEKELRAMRTLDGLPYRLIPLPWPDACYADDGHRLPVTYANFLIINRAVLVPTYGLPQDTAARRTLSLCFPDRTMINIDCRALVEQHGSLHCVTMQYI